MRSLLQRNNLSILVLGIFLLLLYSSCTTAKRRRVLNLPSNKPHFKQIVVLMRQMQNMPEYHGRFFDSNLTATLAASRYMIKLYNDLKTNSVEDDSFNVTKLTATNKTVGGADTIMGILNDGKRICLHYYSSYFK